MKKMNFFVLFKSAGEHASGIGSIEIRADDVLYIYRCVHLCFVEARFYRGFFLVSVRRESEKILTHNVSQAHAHMHTYRCIT